MWGMGLGVRNMLMSKEQVLPSQRASDQIGLAHITLIQCDRSFKLHACKAQVQCEDMGEGNQRRLLGRRGHAFAGSCGT